MMSPHDPVLVFPEEEIRGLAPAGDVRFDFEPMDDSVVVILEDEEMGCLPGSDPDCVPIVIVDDDQRIGRVGGGRGPELKDPEPVIVLHDNEFAGLFS